MKIGLVAHDAKKILMQNFCIAYRGILCKNEIYATGTTGRLIEEVTDLSVYKYLAGHLGGEKQLGVQIENNDMDLVIFLRDPFTAKPHEPDVISAIFELSWLYENKFSESEHPDIVSMHNKTKLKITSFIFGTMLFPPFHYCTVSDLTVSRQSKSPLSRAFISISAEARLVANGILYLSHNRITGFTSGS